MKSDQVSLAKSKYKSVQITLNIISTFYVGAVSVLIYLNISSSGKGGYQPRPGVGQRVSQHPLSRSESQARAPGSRSLSSPRDSPRPANTGNNSVNGESDRFSPLSALSPFFLFQMPAALLSPLSLSSPVSHRMSQPWPWTGLWTPV